eukprot:m.121193 g.121193  ORF g.121193 m.121193 type:complete len:281 (-) comp16196_c0_seq2:1571-2413(-)
MSLAFGRGGGGGGGIGPFRSAHSRGQDGPGGRGGRGRGRGRGRGGGGRGRQARPTPEVKATLQVSARCTGAIIGRQGATVKQLEAESQARIFVGRESTLQVGQQDGLVPVYVSGAARAVVAALRALAELLPAQALSGCQAELLGQRVQLDVRSGLAGLSDAGDFITTPASPLASALSLTAGVLGVCPVSWASRDALEVEDLCAAVLDDAVFADPAANEGKIDVWAQGGRVFYWSMLASASPLLQESWARHRQQSEDAAPANNSEVGGGGGDVPSSAASTN